MSRMRLYVGAGQAMRGLAYWLALAMVLWAVLALGFGLVSKLTRPARVPVATVEWRV